MNNLKLLPVLLLGLTAASNVACGGGSPHDTPDHVTFAAPMLLACGNGAESSIATGDFNGDHRTDIVGCMTTSSVAIFLNQGGGFFGDPRIASISSDGFSLQVHDVDGDGSSDLVTMTKDHSSQISFSRGDGTFAPAVSAPDFPVNCDDYSFSYDGHADALCYEHGSAVAYDIVSDGSEQKIWSVPVPAHPTAKDINNDGNADFVYAIGSTIAVQLGMGGGHFGPTEVIVTANSDIGSLSFGDIDGDGFVDIIASSGSSSLGYTDSFLHNKAGTGFELWNQVAEVDHVGYDFEDVTGDGLMDVVLTQNEQLVVMVGRGDGTFDKTGVLLTGPWQSASGFLFADLGNGKPDLIVGGPNVSVLLRQ